MFNSVEIPSQETAWYLLRAPMSKKFAVIVSILTVWPSEQERIKKQTNNWKKCKLVMIQLIFGNKISSTSMNKDMKIWKI